MLLFSFPNISSGSHLDRSGFRDLPQNDDAALVIWTHFLPLLVHLDHRRSWKSSGQTSTPASHRQTEYMTTPAPKVSNISRLTSQDVKDQIHVRGECLDALHARYSPNGNKLVAVHLGHQVQVLREVFPKGQRSKENIVGKRLSETENKSHGLFLNSPGEVKLQLLLQRLTQVLRRDCWLLRLGFH